MAENKITDAQLVMALGATASDMPELEDIAYQLAINVRFCKVLAFHLNAGGINMFEKVPE